MTYVRTVGDLLVTYDLSRGGTVPTISYRLWDGSQWGPATDLTASGKATGSINTSAILAADSDGLGALDPRTFGEATVDMDAIFPSGTCAALGSAFLKSRSSFAFDAEIKDFIAPIPALEGYFTFTLMPQLFLNARARGLKATISGSSGSMLEATGTLDLFITSGFGIGGGYNYTRIDYTRDSDTLTKVRYHYSGPVFYVALAF